jgi:hypothetical protein
MRNDDIDVTRLFGFFFHCWIPRRVWPWLTPWSTWLTWTTTTASRSGPGKHIPDSAPRDWSIFQTLVSSRDRNHFSKHNHFSTPIIFGIDKQIPVKKFCAGQSCVTVLINEFPLFTILKVIWGSFAILKLSVYNYYRDNCNINYLILIFLV